MLRLRENRIGIKIIAGVSLRCDNPCRLRKNSMILDGTVENLVVGESNRIDFQDRGGYIVNDFRAGKVDTQPTPAELETAWRESQR